MDKSFSFYIPLSKNTGESLTGIASTLSLDRDSEKMSLNALKEMETDIKRLGVNLFGNHEHNWENTLGVIKEASLIDNQLFVDLTLDDPNTNPKIPMLLNKLAKGIKLGLSVGGQVMKEKWEYDKEANKKVKVIDGVRLYEVSVVGIPSNADSYLSIPTQISKSFKNTQQNVYISKCPLCYSNMEKKCKLCLFQKSVE
jgi:HK97 family phage prohead protease